MRQEVMEKFIERNEEIVRLARIMVEEENDMGKLLDYLAAVSSLFRSTLGAFIKTFPSRNGERYTREWVDQYLGEIRRSVLGEERGEFN
jgi:hypothetical protein